MNTLRKLETPLFLLLAGVAACDAPSPALAELVEIAEAPPPTEPRESIVVVDGEDEPIEVADFLGCDAEPMPPDADEPTACDEGACELAAESEPLALCGVGYCTEWTWQEVRFIDNPCGSCSPQPNMPGWKRVISKRWCNACGCCDDWTTDPKNVYCNPC